MSLAKDTTDDDPNHVLCADCGHWRVAHSAFSGCVRGEYKGKDWINCDCVEYVTANTPQGKTP